MSEVEDEVVNWSVGMMMLWTAASDETNRRILMSMSERRGTWGKRWLLRWLRSSCSASKNASTGKALMDLRKGRTKTSNW